MLFRQKKVIKVFVIDGFCSREEVNIIRSPEINIAVTNLTGRSRYDNKSCFCFRIAFMVIAKRCHAVLIDRIIANFFQLAFDKSFSSLRGN